MKTTAIENFNRVVRRQHPDRVCDLGVECVSRGVGYEGARPSSTRPSDNPRTWQDIWGVTWTDVDGEEFPTGPAVESIAELDRILGPDPSGRLGRAREDAERVHAEGLALSVNHPHLLYEKGFNILGPEEFLAALAGEPELSHRFLDMLIEFELGIAAEYASLKPEHVNTNDDYGMQDRLAVSPTMWREYFKPRLKRLIDFYRDALGPDIVVSHHSCGHVMPILEDFIEIGVDILHPVQSTANDLKELRRITSGRLTLAGGIDGQRILPFGSPEDVRREVFRKLDLLWEDGGYLPMPEKMLGVPPENARAMHEAIAEWSRANVESFQARVTVG